MAMEMELPMGWDNWYDEDESTLDVHAESIPDGFVKCLRNRGCVDIEYIASICDTDYSTVIEKLQGSIYQNPDTWGDCFFKGWETAEEYLSGNIRKKLATAKEANSLYPGRFEANVKALMSVKPPMVSMQDIYVTLGSPWVPTSVIQDFVYHVSGIQRNYSWSANAFNVRHDEVTGSWEIDDCNRYHMSYSFAQKFGTPRRPAYDILLRTLNMQSVVVMDMINSPHTKSGKQAVVNKQQTVLALEKQKLLIREFQDWVWKDPQKAELLTSIYEERYASIHQRHFDGNFLDFPGMNPEIAMYPYQRNAVARIIFSPNTLLAHDVGSGKTYIMVAAGMELRRMKLSTKNLYVVPNNIVGQWERIFHTLYPDARVMCVEPKDFTPAKREAVLADIRDNDHDAIIMAYSCFTQIPISAKHQLEELEKQRQKLMKLSQDREKCTTRLMNLAEKIDDMYYELKDEILFEGRGLRSEGRGLPSKPPSPRPKPPSPLYFDELGITRLFVDEAHNFKNVPIDTKIANVMGISKTGSAKCQDMLDKVRVVQKANNGGGVVMATGTPITNSITDAYVCQLYLQSGELNLLDLQNFDSWVGMFAEKTTNFEIDVDTSNYRLATRFARFHNIPELTAMLASVADFHQMDETQGVPEHDGYQDQIVVRTKAFVDYLKVISKRADDVREGRVSRKEDNMLMITTDGRKAALDLRLVDDSNRFTPMSKVFTCASNVARIYKETAEARSTQLVFCDSSTPKVGFNIYDDLKGLLLKLGVREEDIAYIHDATTEAKREKLYSAMRCGKIRILIGSTFKLGLGVNVQDKLIALHHLDVPWRPADMVQREGRILRQGNENPKVEIYRYITEGSFDAYSWQLLETKQRFISDILAGTAEQRSGADVDDAVLNYAEVKALAVGNPLIKERVEVSNELSKLMILQQKWLSQRQTYEQELMEYPAQWARFRDLIPKVKADVESFRELKKELSPEERREIRIRIHQASHPDEPTTEEVEVLEYQGFKVVVPARVSMTHPVVFLRRNGQYMVELGSSDVANLVKIDHYLEDLGKRYEDLRNRLQELVDRKHYMEQELAKDVNYVEEIARCKARLEELDQRLGVEKE